MDNRTSKAPFRAAFFATKHSKIRFHLKLLQHSTSLGLARLVFVWNFKEQRDNTSSVSHFLQLHQKHQELTLLATSTLNLNYKRTSMIVRYHGSG